MFQTMMVATGDSPWSRNAVEHAIRLATVLQQELIITHWAWPHDMRSSQLLVMWICPLECSGES